MPPNVERFLVRDDDGREIEMPHYSVCAGFEYRSRDGRWFPECHPAVLDHLERDIARKRTETWQNEDTREACVRFALEVLERNGRQNLVEASHARTADDGDSVGGAPSTATNIGG
jgi:hypothetical protein